jgi:serine/threonine-protein kinase RsbW
MDLQPFMRSGQTVRLDFDSTFEMLDLVQVVSDHIARLAGLDEEARHWVNVAVRESVINAIKHGNRNDTAKRVHVEFTPLEGTAASQGVSIRVRDEGPGFDPDDVPDPLAPENLLKGSGRGIFLIRAFMDEMVLQRAAEGGMEMVMVKRAGPMQDPGCLSA